MWRSRILLVSLMVGLLVATGSGALLVRPAGGADAERGFHFDAQAGTGGSTPTQIIIMVGTGTFEIGGGDVNGGGIFQIIDNTAPVPKTILAFGTWEAMALVSYNELGTYGAYASGTAIMNIKLTMSDGSHMAASLTVVCNIGAAGLTTGKAEGIYVTIGSTSFTPFAGLTIFDTIGGEGGD